MMKAGESYKVAFSGAGCVGKTTLLNSLRDLELGRYVQFIGEAARAYYSTYPNIPLEVRDSFDHQCTIQQMGMDVELAAHYSTTSNFDRPDYVFTDSSVFDAPVFVAATGDEAGAEVLFNRAQMWLPGLSDISYSQIYILNPGDVAHENDDIRIEPPETRQQHHEMFVSYFSEHGIAFKLLGGSLEDRIEQVLSEIPAV